MATMLPWPAYTSNLQVMLGGGTVEVSKEREGRVHCGAASSVCGKMHWLDITWFFGSCSLRVIYVFLGNLRDFSRPYY